VSSLCSIVETTCDGCRRALPRSLTNLSGHRAIVAIRRETNGRASDDYDLANGRASDAVAVICLASDRVAVCPGRHIDRRNPLDDDIQEVEACLDIAPPCTWDASASSAPRTRRASPCTAVAHRTAASEADARARSAVRAGTLRNRTRRAIYRRCIHYSSGCARRSHRVRFVVAGRRVHRKSPLE